MTSLLTKETYFQKRPIWSLKSNKDFRKSDRGGKMRQKMVFFVVRGPLFQIVYSTCGSDILFE